MVNHFVFNPPNIYQNLQSINIIERQSSFNNM